ncbi:MAG: alpha-2-macroglobulin family protein, partial [Anaerolineae bacterium]
MKTKPGGWMAQHQLSILIGTSLLALIVVAAAGILWWRSRQPESRGTTIPVLVDTGDEGDVSAVEGGVVSSGGASAQIGEDVVPVRLSEGQAQPQAAEPLQQAGGEPLSEDEIERIVARLPPLETEPGDQADFRLPEDLLPPPRPGETIEEPFPPPPEPVEPETVPSGPLEVLRYAPEGEIPLAPFLNVTFNQPMVPLATLESLSAENVPVQIEPALPGTWKWLGTKTLSFEYESTAIDRLPMATEYVATVPAGTTSATGGVLAEAVRWTFRTPPPQVTLQYPTSDAEPLEPVFLVGFDQRIDPQAVLDTIRVTADGRDTPVRLATQDELAADKGASRRAERLEEGRWLAFVAQEPLPKDAAIEVTIGPGTPSAEGPLVTEEAQSYSFRTYAPLRIEDHGCSWYGDECPPLTPFYIRFNNPLDMAAFEESMLRIEPALPDATVDAARNTITIRGQTIGRTTYRVTVDGAIQDTFGQTLGADAVLSFKVGPAEPVLFGPSEALVTLDPISQKPVFTVYAINYSRLKVRAYRVEPSDWPAYKDYLRLFFRQESPPSPPGQLVMDKTVTLEAAADALTEGSIDLSPALDGHYGQLIVVVEPAGLQIGQRNRSRQVVQTWVQVTQIGLDAFADHSEMVAWTTALADGTPLGGVAIETSSGQQLAVSGDDGTARYRLPEQGMELLVARQGSDLAILPRSVYTWGSSTWQPRPVQDELRWYVFDDRGMYRPEEEVHVKGWLRLVGGRQDGDVGLPGEAVESVTYRVIGSQGNELLSGQAEVSALGGFDLSFTVPANANLGYSQVVLEAQGRLGGLSGTSYGHSFQVQEFRRPEFEVTARNETTGPYYAGEHAVVAVEAAYYAGGPLPNAPVTWQVRSTPTNYTPPNWPDFHFGEWIPWWFGYGPAYELDGPWGGGGEVETFTGTTDATGNHYLRLDFDRTDLLRPLSIQAEASVMDVNRQSWAGSTSLLVHPAELYVGMRSERTFVQKGVPLEIELIVVDLDGNAVPDRQVQVQSARMEWRYRQGAWREEAVDVQECTVGSRTEPVTCVFETPAGGEYQISAVVTDGAGRRNQSKFTRWVSGGQRPPSREVEQEEAVLIPDKETYAPGDMAEILVQSPFGPAEGLLTVSRSGLLYTERFRIEEGTATLRVPVEEAHIPNLHLQVDLVGAAERTGDEGEAVPGAPARPAYASGQLDLSIPPIQRTLALQVTPRDRELEPGGETVLDLALTDAGGQPVPDAELAVVVVDEAVLALTGYQLADPVETFYRARSSEVDSTYGRASIVLANPEALSEQGGAEYALAAPAPEAAMEVQATMVVEREVAKDAMAGEEAQGSPIRVRTDFNPLALFAPEVRTDSSGQAQVAIQMPDNLTRYRVMVVAVAGGREFGSGEANMTARLPLMARPSAPRFLNFGDTFELPVVLQNQTDAPMSVEVVLRAGNIALTGPGGWRVRVPAHDRVEVRFPAATDLAGTARFQVAAVSGEYADAATGELPVYTPATTEAFATYGVIDAGAVAQPVAAPEGVYTQFGGLEISTSSTALQALSDAVLYLVSYPFECSEQLASRILAVAALRDVLTAFSAEGLPAPGEMEAAVARDIEELQGLQNADGGFPYWRRGRDSIPYNTIHVAHALQRARLKGFDVPQETQSRVLEYLRQIEDHYPSWYDKRIRQTLSAYALYVRDLMDDPDPAKAKRLLDEAGLEDLSLEAAAWLWQVMLDDPAYASDVAAIQRHITNRAVETAGAANFATSYGDQAYLLLHSNRRTDAIILDALIAGDPDSDLIVKVVNGLLAHRTKGRWGNTQENV